MLLFRRTEEVHRYNEFKTEQTMESKFYRHWGSGKNLGFCARLVAMLVRSEAFSNFKGGGTTD